MAFCLALIALPVAGCGGGDAEPSAPASARVDIASFKFVKDPVKVRAGGRITWVNQDRAPHTAENDSFDTGRLDLGDEKAVKFDRPGRFEYFCIYHRFMTGTVEVVE